MQLRNVKKLQQESRQLHVRRVDLQTLVVESKTDPLGAHIVRVKFLANGVVETDCTCPWSARFHGVGCTHVMAALEFLAEQKGRTLSFWLTEADAERQKQRLFSLTNKRRPEQPLYITSRRGVA